MAKQKNSAFVQIFYTIGTLIMVVMMVIVTINFAHDARVLQKPLLSTSTVKPESTGNADGYKTIKYKKPAAESTKKADKPKTTAKPASTPEPAASTTVPVKTPEP